MSLQYDGVAILIVEYGKNDSGKSQNYYVLFMDDSATYTIPNSKIDYSSEGNVNYDLIASKLCNIYTFNMIQLDVNDCKLLPKKIIGNFITYFVYVNSFSEIEFNENQKMAHSYLHCYGDMEKIKGMKKIMVGETNTPLVSMDKVSAFAVEILNEFQQHYLLEFISKGPIHLQKNTSLSNLCSYIRNTYKLNWAYGPILRSEKLIKVNKIPERTLDSPIKEIGAIILTKDFSDANSLDKCVLFKIKNKKNKFDLYTFLTEKLIDTNNLVLAAKSMFKRETANLLQLREEDLQFRITIGSTIYFIVCINEDILTKKNYSDNLQIITKQYKYHWTDNILTDDIIQVPFQYILAENLPKIRMPEISTSTDRGDKMINLTGDASYIMQYILANNVIDYLHYDIFHIKMQSIINKGDPKNDCTHNTTVYMSNIPISIDTSPSALLPGSASLPVTASATGIPAPVTASATGTAQPAPGPGTAPPPAPAPATGKN